MISPKVTELLVLFNHFIKKFEAYDGQICVCTPTFRRELMSPVLETVKDLEASI